MENEIKAVVMTDVPALVPASNPVERMMQLIERVACDPNANADKARAFLDMQIIVMEKQAHIEFQAAKARIKEKLQHVKIVKTRVVAHDIDKNDKSLGKREAYRYAALEDIDKILGPMMAEEGITDSYTMEPAQNGLYLVKCMLSKGLYTEENCIPLPLDNGGKKSNVQFAASTFTFGKRNALCGAFGLVVIGQDDDGVGGPIDDAQAKHIKDLLRLTESDVKKFLKYMKAETVEQILFKDYRKATSALDEKMKENAAKKAAELKGEANG